MLCFGVNSCLPYISKKTVHNCCPTLKVFEERITMSLQTNEKEKHSTSYKVITLLDQTRLDEMGVDEMSI